MDNITVMRGGGSPQGVDEVPEIDKSFEAYEIDMSSPRTSPSHSIQSNITTSMKTSRRTSTSTRATSNVTSGIETSVDIWED